MPSFRNLTYVLYVAACCVVIRGTAAAQYTAGPNIVISPTMGAAPGASAYISVTDAPYFVGWSTLHTSANGGCPSSTSSPIDTAINETLATAAALPGTQSARVIIDCGGIINSTLVLPANRDVIVDQQGNTLTVNLPGIDVWYQAEAASSQIALLNVSLQYPSGTPYPSAGAAVDLQSCSGCRIEHLRYSGDVNDLFALGTNQTPPPSSLGRTFADSSIDDVRGSPGSAFHGAAIRFKGSVLGAFFSNFSVASAGDGIGVDADSTNLWQFGASTYPNWDTLYFENIDFEQTRIGFNVNMPEGLINDMFLEHVTVNNSGSGPAVLLAASGVFPSPTPTATATVAPFGIIRRFRFVDDAFNVGTPAPMSSSSPAAVELSNAHGYLYDIQMTGGSASSQSGDAISIGANVLGTQWTGVQERSSRNCGIDDNGTETMVSGNAAPGGLGLVLPSAPASFAPYGPNAVGICIGASESGGFYAAIDARNDANSAFTVAAPAGTSSPQFITDSNVNGYSPATQAIVIATPAAGASPANLSLVNNAGYYGTAQGIACSPLFNFASQSGTAACLSSTNTAGSNGFGLVGILAAAALTLGNGTQWTTSSTGQCGTAADAFVFSQPTGTPYLLSGDGSGNIGICGSLTTLGNATINGTAISPATGKASCTIPAGGFHSCGAGISGITATQCTAVYDAGNTTVALNTLEPLETSLVGSDLQLYGYSSVSSTLSFTFDYTCL